MHELRNQGGRIERVPAGERVAITCVGRPVAVLVPSQRRPLSAETLVERFRRLPSNDSNEFGLTSTRARDQRRRRPRANSN